MAEATDEKRQLFKECQKNKSIETRKLYVAKRKGVKAIVAAAKETESKNIVEMLKNGNFDALRTIYKMARRSKKDKRDIVGIPCIGGETLKSYLVYRKFSSSPHFFPEILRSKSLVRTTHEVKKKPYFLKHQPNR